MPLKCGGSPHSGKYLQNAVIRRITAELQWYLPFGLATLHNRCWGIQLQSLDSSLAFPPATAKLKA